MDTHLGVIPYHPVENADNNTFLLPTMCPWRLANGCDDLITAELKRGMTRQKITDILAWEAVCGTTRREIHLNVYLSSGALSNSLPGKLSSGRLVYLLPVVDSSSRIQHNNLKCPL